MNKPFSFRDMSWRMLTPFMQVSATGATITTDGDYKVYSFSSSGVFNILELGTDPTYGNKIDLLIEGAAGTNGGDTDDIIEDFPGTFNHHFGFGGEGGCGGFVKVTSLVVTTGNKTITLAGNNNAFGYIAGAGGTGGSGNCYGDGDAGSIGQNSTTGHYGAGGGGGGGAGGVGDTYGGTGPHYVGGEGGGQGAPLSVSMASYDTAGQEGLYVGVGGDGYPWFFGYGGNGGSLEISDSITGSAVTYSSRRNASSRPSGVIIIRVKFK